jgi:hypothetical protein
MFDKVSPASKNDSQFGVVQKYKITRIFVLLLDSLAAVIVAVASIVLVIIDDLKAYLS